MAVIRHKVWKKLSPTATPILERLDPSSADILQIARVTTPNPELLHIVPYGNDVDTQSLLKIISELADNDWRINNEIIATNEIISEGVFDIPKSGLTNSQETALAALQAIIDGGGSLTSEEQEDYDYYIKLKYGYRFDLTLDETSGIEITVGPGKFKVNEESQSSVYFVTDVSTFSDTETDEELDIPDVQTDGYYRLDLIEVVFRDDETGNAIPRLIYSPGVESDEPSPGHVVTSRTLTDTYATFPLWSVLVKDDGTGTLTEVIRITQIFDWVGLRALLNLTNMLMHEKTYGSLTYYGVHHYEDIPLRDYNGNILGGEYGEGTVIEEVTSDDTAPYYHIEDEPDYIPNPVQAVPDNFESLKEGSVQNFPFILDSTYNEYISILDVDFTQFSVAFDKYDDGGSEPEEDREGLELHIYTAHPFATEDKLKEFEVITTEYDLSPGDIDGSPALPVTSVAFQIDGDIDELTKICEDDNTYADSSGIPVAGDFVLVSYGKGLYQVAELLATHSKTGAIRDVVVTKPFKVFLDDDGGYPSPPRIMFFRSSTEQLVGNEIKDEFDEYTDWYNALTSSEKSEIDAAYPWSAHTGITKMPWDSEDLVTPDIKKSYNVGGDILTGGGSPGYRKIDFPAKLSLKLNKWYFIKCQVYQKTDPMDTYEIKPRVVYQNPLHASVQDFDAITGWYDTIYIKNFGLYDSTDEESRRIVKLSDDYGDIQDEYGYRLSQGKPVRWRIIATNLDNEVMAEPPEMDDEDIGTAYFDVIRGKIIFHEDEAPVNLKITCNIDNVLHGRSDTENLLHIESNTETITLAAKLADMTNDILELAESVSASRVMEYKGPHSKILKNATNQFNFIHDDTRGLGSTVYGCYDDATPAEPERMEQEKPVSRLIELGTTSDDWSLAKAQKTMTYNVYGDVTDEKNVKAWEIPAIISTSSGFEETSDKRIEFENVVPLHMEDGKNRIRRIGFRLSDINSNKVEDLGLNGTANEWQTKLYLAVHNNLNQSQIPGTEGEVGPGPITERVITITQSRLEEIWEEFERRGVAVDIGGYHEIEFTAGTNITDQALGADNTYYFKINGSEYDIAGVDGDTYQDVIDKINAEISGFTATWEETPTGITEKLRITNDTVGVGNDCTITSGSSGTDLVTSLLNSPVLGTPVSGADGYLTDEEAQNRMWIYFELSDFIELADGDFHFHLFVYHATASDEDDVTKPNILRYNKTKWQGQEAATIPPDPTYTDSDYYFSQKLFIQPLHYDATTYKGGYGVDYEVPRIIDLNEDLVIDIRDGSSVDVVSYGTPGSGNLTYNVTPDVDVVDVMYANLSTQSLWDDWAYESYIGIDPLNGRIKLPSSFPSSFTYDFDNDLLFGEFNMRWPFSSLETKSFGDAEDPNVSLHDKRYEYIKTKDEVVDFLDDKWEMARIRARSIRIDWLTGKDYKENDLISDGNRIYKCNTDHTSSSQFINDIGYWTLVSGGGGTVYDVSIPGETHDFEIGEVLRYRKDDAPEGNPDFGWLRAQADESLHLGIGIVLRVNDTDHFTVISAGYAENMVGVNDGSYTPNILDDQGDELLPNTMYYLSKDVAGGITKTKPYLGQTILYTLGPTNPSYVEGSTNPAEMAWVTDCIVDVDDTDYSAVSKIEIFNITSVTDQLELLNYPISQDYVDIDINGAMQHEGYIVQDNLIIFDNDLEIGWSVRVKYDFSVRSNPGALIEKQSIIAT